MPNYDCSQKVSHYIAACVVHSSVLAWISFVHIDKDLYGGGLEISTSSRRVSVKLADNCWHEFPSNYELAQIDFEMNISFPPSKPSRFWNANFPPYISPSKIIPSKRVFEKYELRGLFSEFNGIQISWFGNSLLNAPSKLMLYNLQPC